MLIRKNVTRFFIGSLISAFVVSIFPIWQTWFVSSWEEVGDKGNLYAAFSHLPRQAQDFGLIGALLRYHAGNLLLLIVTTLIGGVLAIYFGGKFSRRS